jgi:predicted dehydrogenase
MITNIIRWGILGPGRIAQKFATDLQLVEGAVLQGVASRDKAKADAFARQFGAVASYGSYEELVADPAIDVVYIATPHVFHTSHTLLCLRYGKAVLCEKPFAMHAAEAESMIAEARLQKVFLMDAFWTRFIPSTEKVLSLLAENAIGQVEYLRADFGFVADNDPEKRVFNRSLGGGSLLDVGIYPVFLSLLLLGVPDRIHAMANFTQTGVDSVCTMLFDHPGGKKSVLESAITANTHIEAMIFGTQGTIRMHRRFHHTGTITITRNNGTSETIHTEVMGTGYCHEIIEVMDCLHKGHLESEKLPLSLTLDLIRTLDRIRKEIGLTYP